jgi:hypothetical protein
MAAQHANAERALGLLLEAELFTGPQSSNFVPQSYRGLRYKVKAPR